MPQDREIFCKMGPIRFLQGMMTQFSRTKKARKRFLAIKISITLRWPLCKPRWWPIIDNLSYFAEAFDYFVS